MAKKYAQNLKDRMDESRAMKRKDEKRKGLYMYEDWSAPALLPQEPMMQYINPSASMRGTDVPSLFTAADEQIEKDCRKLEELVKNPQKY